jgi:methylenetetrahydrofolate dehydrogenase (NADP+) / methenyltetrahydrofolate cyclohydrolase
MELIDGKKIAEEIRAEIRTEVARLIDDEDKAPHLAAILIGDDPASRTYVAGKEKACKSVGIISSVYKMSASTSETELLDLIDFLNRDPEIDGFIVQLPLPAHISEERVIQRIEPSKDVDGFHPLNLGRMLSGLPAYLPATPYGILQLLERSGVETEGKHCVVLGRSKIVGTPLAFLLSRKAKPGNCTVTICHSKSQNIERIAASADILVAAVGQAGFVHDGMVKNGAVVIDVGIHRVPSDDIASGHKLVGDVRFEEVSKKCSMITPVPGGVGPMTITALLQNTLMAHKREIYG